MLPTKHPHDGFHWWALGPLVVPSAPKLKLRVSLVRNVRWGPPHTLIHFTMLIILSVLYIPWCELVLVDALPFISTKGRKNLERIKKFLKKVVGLYPYYTTLDFLLFFFL